MLQWDSDNESVGDMIRVSDALGHVVANYDRNNVKNDLDDDIDEMELLQLRSLVQQIKSQTVLSYKFMEAPVGYQGTGTNSLDRAEDVEAKYRQLMADHSDVLGERDELEDRLNQLIINGGENNHKKITKAEKERDEARKETEAAKLEVENLKISQRNLQYFYQEQVSQLGTGARKTRINCEGDTVSVEDYNRLKELHRVVSWNLEESELMASQQQEDLTQAVNRAKNAEQEIRTLRFSRNPGQAGDSRALSSQDEGKGRGLANFGGGTFEIEMTIPGQKVPLVIGKGGEIIKRLMEETGCKIWIVQEDTGVASQKALKILGTEDNAVYAKTRVTEILEAKQDYVKFKKKQPRDIKKSNQSQKGLDGNNGKEKDVINSEVIC